MTGLETDFAQDLLRGADEIAAFLYGDREQRRKVYHLVTTSKLPTFKLGSMICARRSVLLQWIEAQERRHANDNAASPGASVPRNQQAEVNEAEAIRQRTSG